MIYTDGIHLVGNTLQELHDFAHKKLKLKREWFQDHIRHPHYDLTTQRARKRAIRAGAQVISTRELIRISHASFNQWIDSLAIMNQEGHHRRTTQLINPVTSPRYDNVYYEGLKWLDSLAGPPLIEGEVEAVFSDGDGDRK